jgi:hypothetical protein
MRHAFDFGQFISASHLANGRLGERLRYPLSSSPGGARKGPQADEPEEDEREEQIRPISVLSPKKTILTTAVPAVPIPAKAA